VKQGIKYTFSVSQEPVRCFGGMDGKATVIASGAQPPYTYLWANGDKTPAADSLKAGLYAVSVTDASGCTAVTLAEVKEPKQLVIDSIRITHILCFGGNNGSANVFAVGGVPSYTYNWSDAKTGQSVTGLTAGPYTVTVTDQNGCTFASSTLVSQPPDLLAPISILKPETCAGACDGGITLNVSGGIALYGIVWDNAAIPAGSFAPQNLCPGAYRATITDANSCSKTIQANVLPAIPITVQRTVQPPLCANDQNGSITAMVNGGTTPYQFAWNTGAGGSTLQNLSCGIYTLTITDSLNCTRIVSDTLPCPNPIVLDSIVPKPVRCFGEANGEIRIAVQGGTGMLNYLWSDPNQQFDPIAVNLLQGTYTVTVTDANGCTLTAVAVVTQPPLLGVSISATHVTCFGGNDGAAVATVNGGIMPYTYKWSSSQDSASISGLNAGTYSLTVTDASGCSFTGAAALITQPASPTQITITQTKLACFGTNNGEALATATGNNGGPFNFVWSHNFNGPAPANLGIGTYTVTASDQKQCTATQTVAIQQWNEIKVGLLRAAPTCFNGMDGQVAVNQISGGAGGMDFSKFHYTWSIPGKPDTLYINGLTGGEMYGLTVTDEVGCSTTVMFTMLNQEPIAVELIADSVRCFGLSDGAVRINAVQSPSPIINYAWSNGGSGTEQKNLTADTYTVTLTDAKGCTITAVATVGEPSALQIQLDATTLVCNSDSNGSIQAIVQGGTPGYTYSWNTGAPTSQISNLGPGNYRITATDQYACTIIDSTSLTQPNPPDIQVETTDPECFGANDGLFSLKVTGNAPPYRYSLDGTTFGGSGVFLGLGAGQYSAYVRDGMGCITTVSVSLNQPPPVEVSFGPDASVILGDSLLLTPDLFNAVGLVSYSWRSALADSLYCTDSPDCTTILVRPEYSNTYFVTVTDANGCRGEGSTRVEVVKPRGVFVPTGFSPNGDLSNDLLIVYGKSRQIKQVNVFRVYDRWGELVYEDVNFPVNDEQRGWNGQFRGKDAQTGVYVWYVEVEYLDGFVEGARGNTTLIR
jgi:gliding motility-associated-like protein